MTPEISVIIPARNEEFLIGRTIASVLAATRCLQRSRLSKSRRPRVELLVVDNNSTDDTCAIVKSYEQSHEVRLLHCHELGAARARNLGARHANGELLVFLDADTSVSPEALTRVAELNGEQSFEAGITRLASLEGGWTAWLWWTFWEYVRCLPLARAKAMPAFMFCTRAVFDEFGPFDERVAIGEEWPILASLYRTRRSRLVYDRTLTACSSSRRMELQPFGYWRTFAKYVWAILHFSGRVNFSDRFRGDVFPDPPPHTLSWKESHDESGSS